MKLRITVSVEVDVPPDIQPPKKEDQIRLFRDAAEFEAQTRVRNWFPGRNPKVTSTATIELK